MSLISGFTPEHLIEDPEHGDTFLRVGTQGFIQAIAGSGRHPEMHFDELIIPDCPITAAEITREVDQLDLDDEAYD